MTAYRPIAAEVAARAEAEDALRHSRDVLSLAMRGGAMGAWSRDIDSNTVVVEPASSSTSSGSAGAVQSDRGCLLRAGHDDDKERPAAPWARQIESSTDYIVDFRVPPRQRRWRWMEGRGRAVYGDDGRPRSVYGIGIDVTGRKRTEAALEAAHATPPKQPTG